MGAVKTNRRRKAMMWSFGHEVRYGMAEWVNKCLSKMYMELNNPRKMAGLPLIRRAKS
jgi:hypothetical protein